MPAALIAIGTFVAPGPLARSRAQPGRDRRGRLHADDAGASTTASGGHAAHPGPDGGRRLPGRARSSAAGGLLVPVPAGRLARLRMYHGAREVWDGWSKNASFARGRRRRRRALAGAGALAALAVAAPGGRGRGPAPPRPPRWRPSASPGSLALVALQRLSSWAVPTPARYAPTLPLGMLVLSGAVARGAVGAPARARARVARAALPAGALSAARRRPAQQQVARRVQRHGETLGLAPDRRVQPGDAVGMAARDLLAIGPLHLVGAAPRAPGRAARPPRRACAARRPGRRRRGGRGRRAGRGRGGRARRPGSRAPRRGRPARPSAARAPRPPPAPGSPGAGRAPTGSSRSAASIASGSERQGLVAGDVPARAGLAAAHRGDHLRQASCGRGCRARAPRRGPGAPGAGRPSRARPGRPTTSARPAACAAPVGRGGPAGRSGRPRRGPPASAVELVRPGPRGAAPPRARPGPRPARARAAVERGAQARGAGGLAGGQHPPPARPGVVRVGALQRHGGRGGVVQGEQGGREAGGRARRVADAPTTPRAARPGASGPRCPGPARARRRR